MVLLYNAHCIQSIEFPIVQQKIHYRNCHTCVLCKDVSKIATVEITETKKNPIIQMQTITLDNFTNHSVSSTFAMVFGIESSTTSFIGCPPLILQLIATDSGLPV